ncbi:MAG: inverse autotransporter beta domain-containing protein, partial [Gammaproteobacteria bacterium]
MNYPPHSRNVTTRPAFHRMRRPLGRLPMALCMLLTAWLLSSCLLPQSKQGGAVQQYRKDISNFIVPGEEELLVLADAGNDPSSDEVQAVYRRHYKTRIESSLNAWGGRQLQKLGFAFGENFRLDSSMNWSAARGIRGAIEAVIPLHEEKNKSWFLQPGAVFWKGVRDQTRRDFNIGIVHRQFLEGWRMVIGGGKILGVGAGAFYDYSAAHGLSRFGLGFDLQDEYNYASAQVYTPVQSNWNDSEEDYQERVTSGMELYSRTRISRTVDVVAAFTAWRRYDELTGRDRGFGPGLRGGFDWKIARGLSFNTNYDQRRTGGDNRWQVSMHFDFPVNLRIDLPAQARAGGQPRFDLWRPFEREQRVLYAERRVQMRVIAPDVQAGEGDGKVQLKLQLEQTFDAAVVGRVIPRSGTGPFRAESGDDFEAAAQNFTIAAGATGADVNITIIDDDEVEYDETFRAEIAVDSAPSRVVAGAPATVT